MVCEHLSELEQWLIGSGVAITYRGQPWSRHCREWVYFDAALDTEAIRQRLVLAPQVTVHHNTDPKSGIEKGFYCEQCHDAVMGQPGSAKPFP